MNALLLLLGLFVGAGVVFLAPAQGPAALIFVVVLSGGIIFLLARSEVDRQFLIRVFVIGLLMRMVVGVVVFRYSLQDFFGGDAITYDMNGYFLQQGWHGNKYYGELANVFLNRGGGVGGFSARGAWAMLYLVAGVYELVGRNVLAVQFINAVLGAATAVIIFLCAQHIFGNTRVARTAAVLTAFCPSLVLWSSQGLKDGPIVFVLALSILATLKLTQRLTVKYAVVLSLSLISLLGLRFYVFYMMVAAIAGAFVIAMTKTSAQGFFRQAIAVMAVGLALTWFGVVRYASAQLDTFANLQEVQRSRLDLAQSAQSGFGRDVDVSTTEGAIGVIPTGLVYLFFAPFPWQLTSLRQTITLPEMILWWAAFPMLLAGLWFSIRYRLREISSILIFTTMLSIAYSIFQGNVGTAYRQRAQLMVFYFIFVAVGITLLREKREERIRRNQEKNAEALRQRREWELRKAARSQGRLEQPAESTRPR